MMSVDQRIKELNPSHEMLINAVESLSDNEKNIYFLVEREKIDIETAKLITGLVKDVIRVRLRKAKKQLLSYITHKEICTYSKIL